MRAGPALHALHTVRYTVRTDSVSYTLDQNALSARSLLQWREGWPSGYGHWLGIWYVAGLQHACKNMKNGDFSVRWAISSQKGERWLKAPDPHHPLKSFNVVHAMQLLGKTFHLSTIRYASTYFLISILLFLLNNFLLCAVRSSFVRNCVQSNHGAEAQLYSGPQRWDHI